MLHEVRRTFPRHKVVPPPGRILFAQVLAATILASGSAALSYGNPPFPPPAPQQIHLPEVATTVSMQGSVRVAGKRSINVSVVDGRESGSRLTGRKMQRRNDDNATTHGTWFESAGKIVEDDLALVFVTMDAAGEEERRSNAFGDHNYRDRYGSPTGVVMRIW